MSDQQPDLLELIAQRIGAKDDRAWAERLDGAELTRQEAVGKVTEILREQLVRLSGGSKSLGMNGFLGLLWVEEAFPSLPSLPTKDEVEIAIEQSNTDYKTFQALRILARLEYSEIYPALKTWEKDLISGLKIEPRMPKGPSTFRDAQRNMLLVSQVRQLRIAGFKPTRNEVTSSHTSGCDIVAEAMTEIGHTMTYAAVEAVWKKRDTIIPRPKLLVALLQKSVLGALPSQIDNPSEK